MRNRKWFVVLTMLMAAGLIAAGCGDDEDTTTASTADTTEATTEDTSSDDSGEVSSEGNTPEDVYNACIDVIEGTAAEEAGQTGCEQARDAFEQCLTQSEDIDDDSARETAIGVCQDAADQAVDALEAAG